MLEGFREGRPAAFAEVVRLYDRLVRSIARRYWNTLFDQEEAMQEIWPQAFKQRASLDPARLDQFGPWLSVLARNRCIDLLRKQGREIGRIGIIGRWRPQA